MIREEIELNLETYRAIYVELNRELKEYKKKNKHQIKLKEEVEKNGLEVLKDIDYSIQIKELEEDIQLVKKIIRRYENVLSK